MVDYNRQTNSSSHADILLDQLLRKGCINTSRKTQAFETIGVFLKSVSVPLKYEEDLKCLHESILHYSTSYIKNTLMLSARTTIRGDGSMGRLFQDKDVSNAAKEITREVLGEIGDNYQQRLHIYFGNKEGVITFIYNRVHDAICDYCVEQNKKTLSKNKAKQIVSQNINQKENLND